MMVLQVNPMFGGGGGGPLVLWQDFATSSVTSSSQTLEVGIGEAAADRRVYVLCLWADSNSSRTLNSATIGGVTATLFSARGASLHMRLIAADVSTGITAGVSLTFASTLATPPTLSVWAVYKQASPIASAQNGFSSFTAAESTTEAVTGAVSTAQRGFNIHGIMNGGTGRSASSADATFRATNDVGSRHVFDNVVEVAGTVRDFTFTVTPTISTLSAASWALKP
jgi:hypothetical protein